MAETHGHPDEHTPRTVRLGAHEPLARATGDRIDPAAQRADSLLDNLAKRHTVPPRLSWRVFAVSAQHLPRVPQPAGSWRRVTRTRVHTSAWGQLAMAASVALTFVAASWFIMSPDSTLPDNGYAQHTPVIESDRTMVTLRDAAPVPSGRFQPWLIGSELEHLESLDTALADLASDMLMLRNDLGM